MVLFLKKQQRDKAYVFTQKSDVSETRMTSITYPSDQMSDSFLPNILSICSGAAYV